VMVWAAWRDQGRRRGGGEDLASVASGRNPSRDVHVIADVTLAGYERCPRVQPDAHADRSCCQLLRDRGGGRERARRRLKGDEERIPLRVDLNPAVRSARLPHDAPVLAESIRISLRAKLVQELRRALYVREEKRDGPDREVVAHVYSIAARHVAMRR
jgi:hypothetical protein